MSFCYFFFTTLQYCFPIFEVALLCYFIYLYLSVFEHIEKIISIDCNIYQIPRVFAKYQ